MLCLHALELDGNLLARDDVGTEVDVTERSGTNLAADAVFITDTKILPDTNTQSGFVTRIGQRDQSSPTYHCRHFDD